MGAKSIKKNYFYNLSYQILNVLLPLLTTPYISRVLGAANIGIYSYTDSVTGFFLLFASLGVLNYGSRETARVRDDIQSRSVLFWELIFFKLIAVVASYLAFFCFFQIEGHANILVYWILSINFLTSLSDISWFFSGMEMFKHRSLRNMLVKILGALLIFVFVKDADDLPVYVSCIVVPGLVGNLVLWFDVRKYIIKVPLRNLNIGRHIRDILVFFIPAVSVQIYHTVDKLMLQWILKDNYENGLYSQAYKIITILLTILTSYNAVMFARMSNLYKKEDYQAIESYMDKSIPFIEMLSFAMATGLVVIAHRFVPAFFGEGYEEVSVLLQIFAPILILTGLSNMIGTQCLIPAQKQGKSNIATVTGAVTNVILNAALIPRLGSIGACIATVLSETVIFMLMCKFQKGIFLRICRLSLNYVYGAIIMGSVVSCVDWFIPNNLTIVQNIFAIMLMVLLGVIVYFGFLILKKDNMTISLLHSILKIKR